MTATDPDVLVVTGADGPCRHGAIGRPYRFGLKYLLFVAPHFEVGREDVCVAAMIEEQLAIYKTRQAPLDLGLVVREYLARYPRARHFDIARIVIDQAVRLGVAQANRAPCALQI